MDEDDDDDNNNKIIIIIIIIIIINIKTVTSLDNCASMIESGVWSPIAPLMNTGTSCWLVVTHV